MPSPTRRRLRRSVPCRAAALLSAALLAGGSSLAQTPAPAAPAASAPEASPPENSALDAPLLYQLLIGEIELRNGQPATAFEVILDAARRTKDEALFRRAVGIALEARALEQALAATRQWRLALPGSLEAMRLQLQMLAASGRAADIGEPLRALLKATPEADRAGLIAALPRFLQRGSDPKKVAAMLSEALQPYGDAEPTRVPVRVSTGRAWLAAGEPEIALALARDAQRLQPDAPGPALLALELMPRLPAAEAVVQAYLAAPGATTPMRLAYVRALTGAQRYADAARELETATREQPNDPAPLLTLGVLYVELKQPREAEATLLRYLQLVQAPRGATPGTDAATAATADDDDEAGAARPERGRVQAWLSLAQLAEQRGDWAQAESWLAKVDDPQRALEVQSRRATMLARQGRIAQARELIRRVPERSDDDARAKLSAEAGVLREVKRWKDAFEVLAGAVQRFPQDADLLYEQAMVAEKLDRADEMEQLLRRVIALKPDSPHAYNALGYSLADRGQRLTEARDLIARALELAPGDPFITDSLGWVEFRLGRSEEALRLLRQAYAARPDAEIGAHLGEVLWASGQRDEARRVWREARARDAANEVLRETLARLRADP